MRLFKLFSVFRIVIFTDFNVPNQLENWSFLDKNGKFSWISNFFLFDFCYFSERFRYLWTFQMSRTLLDHFLIKITDFRVHLSHFGAKFLISKLIHHSKTWDDLESTVPTSLEYNIDSIFIVYVDDMLRSMLSQIDTRFLRYSNIK